MSIILNNIDKSYKANIREQEDINKLFDKTTYHSIDLEILNFEKKNIKNRKSTDISMFLGD